MLLYSLSSQPYGFPPWNLIGKDSWRMMSGWVSPFVVYNITTGSTHLQDAMPVASWRFIRAPAIASWGVFWVPLKSIGSFAGKFFWRWFTPDIFSKKKILEPQKNNQESFQWKTSPGLWGNLNSRQLLRSQFSKLGAVGRHSFLLPTPISWWSPWRVRRSDGSVIWGVEYAMCISDQNRRPLGKTAPNKRV